MRGGFIAVVLLTACAAAPDPYEASKITRAEAKANVCPAHIIEAGASESDCACAARELYRLGQDGRAMRAQEKTVFEGFEGSQDGRSVAIGTMRLEAFEVCGFFEDDHPVNKGL